MLKVILSVLGITMLIAIICYYFGISIQLVALVLAGYAFLSTQ